MMQEVKKYNVTVLRESYTLLSDEPEQQIYQAAQLVDSVMSEIQQKCHGLELSKIAVLAALKLASSLVSGKYQVESSQQSIKALINKIETLL